MDEERMEDINDQVNEALREAKVEELAGYLMALHKLQVDIATGAIEAPAALRRAKEITKKAVEAHQDLKELTTFALGEEQRVTEDNELDWLDDLSEDDWDNFSFG
ncbi:MAG: hypothetical protein KKA19_07625 [Candidatus Margulisbacteria bacterium]|nr:hypothetical protein [Candidatus Margulisiibacteriota bacterium]